MLSYAEVFYEGARSQLLPTSIILTGEGTTIQRREEGEGARKGDPGHRIHIGFTQSATFGKGQEHKKKQNKELLYEEGWLGASSRSQTTQKAGCKLGDAEEQNIFPATQGEPSETPSWEFRGAH